MKAVDKDMSDGTLLAYPWCFHRHGLGDGPGMLLKSFVPREKRFPEAKKLAMLLEPLPDAAAAVAAHDRAVEAQARDLPPINKVRQNNA